jgi:uncharacterized protein (DUF1697 family)
VVRCRRMADYVALLRGIMPHTAKMSDLREAFETAGFFEIRTVLASGNVLFSASRAPEETLEARALGAMEKRLGRTFPAIIRPIESIRQMLASDPFKKFRLKPGSKRVVTFLRQPPSSTPKLPVELSGARILAVRGAEAYTAYVPSPRGPVFMTLIEETFGKDVTTRTWETLARIAGGSA